MEDENELVLSLGLSCGGSSVRPKSKNVSSLDPRAEEVAGRGKMVNEFKSIFEAVPQKPDSATGTQRTDSLKAEENFFRDLSKTKEENYSLNLSGRGFWVTDSNKPVEIEEDNQLETANKRKISFDEINHQKKHESDVHHDGRARISHISMTEDGSGAENEDVADSEAENSTSRPISHQGDGSKRLVQVDVSSDAPKVVCGVADLSATDFNGQKRSTGSSEKDFRHVNLTYDASFPIQQVNMMNVPYPSLVKEFNSVCAQNPPIPGVMQVMPTATGERVGGQPVSNGSVPVMFGYPSVQPSTLDKDNSWGLVSRPQQIHPSFAGRGQPNTAALRVTSNNISEAMSYEGRQLDRSKGDGKQHVTEEGPTSQPEVVKGSSTNLRAKDVLEQSTREGSSIDFSAIKPGLAADVKFGGDGSCPNLPWVSTTGSGSNGRRISGVTYRCSSNQIRIVCACHGSHMTPEEFVQHANEDQANPESIAVLATASSGNPAASA